MITFLPCVNQAWQTERKAIPLAKKRVVRVVRKKAGPKKTHFLPTLLACSIVLVGTIYLLKNPGIIKLVLPFDTSGSGNQTQEEPVRTEPYVPQQIGESSFDPEEPKNVTDPPQIAIPSSQPTIEDTHPKALTVQESFNEVWAATVADQYYHMNINVDLNARYMLFANKKIQIDGYVDNKGGIYSGDVYIKMPEYAYDYSYSAPHEKIYFENETRLYSPVLGAIVSIPMNFASYDTGLVQKPTDSALSKATLSSDGKVFTLNLNENDIKIMYKDYIDYLLHYFDVEDNGGYTDVQATLVIGISNGKISSYTITASGKMSGAKCTASIIIKII